MSKIRNWFSKNEILLSEGEQDFNLGVSQNADLGTYEALYEAHAINNPMALSVGGGDYETIGRAELDILRNFGLKSNSTFFDFGCGTGRLGKHAIEFLDPGKYFGSDISESMLKDFKISVLTEKSFSLFHQRDDSFPSMQVPIDVFAAFSVFTHMEMEDTYRYLCSLKKITNMNSIAVISLIDYGSKLGNQIFIEQASLPHDPRWMGVRSFCTSRDSFEVVAELSGWRIQDWVHGDNKSGLPKYAVPGQFWEFGQSVVVLKQL
jgi:SAM-dependent methyltransferase